jgi:hypothetical protein
MAEHPTLWDHEKNIQCTPLLASDGTMRCLPDSSYGVLFLDSACKHAVIGALRDVCAGSTKYYFDGDGAGQCGTGVTTVYTAGAPIDTPQALYPHNAFPCSLLDRTTPPSEGMSYYEGIPSDPTEWVSFEDEAVPVTDALAATVWVGTDGSRLPHGFALLPSKRPCEPLPPPPQDPRPQRMWCIPTLRARLGDGYPTDECTGEHLAGACGPTDVIELDPSRVTLLETGERVSDVYFMNPNENSKCMTFPPPWTSAPNPSVYYRSSPPLTLSRYPKLSHAKQGADRIQIEYLTSDGKNLRIESYVDTQYGEPCTPTELATGGTWCVPAAFPMTTGKGGLFNEYADSTCTDRPIVTADDPAIVNPFLFVLVYPAGHACTTWGKPTLHTLARYSGATFQSVDGQCVPAGSTPPHYSKWWVPGEAIDPSGVIAELLQ